MRVCLDDICASKDTFTCGRLLQILNDELPDEAMFLIIHAVEQWGDREYCISLSEAAETLWSTAPKWAKILHLRLLNSSSCKRQYLEILRSATPSVRATVRRIYEAVAINWPTLDREANQIIREIQ